MIWSYDTGYSPPAPCVDVRIGRPEETPTVGPVRALLDSGADGCLVPLSILESLRVPMVGSAYLSGIDGASRLVSLYVVDLEVGRQHLPASDVVGDDFGGDIVLGRNLLNKLLIVLDGPRQTVEVRD